MNSFSVKKVRRAFNVIDRIFQRDKPLLETLDLVRQPSSLDAIPITALTAFKECIEVVAEIDRRSTLKQIVAADLPVESNGKAAKWEFLFDHPDRQAKSVCCWHLPWSETRDDFGPPEIILQVTPFPPPGNSMRTMVEEGDLLCRQLTGLWKKELQRCPTLPVPFRDSSDAMAELVEQGLDPAVDEFSLTGSCALGEEASWVARTRDREFRTGFV